MAEITKKTELLTSSGALTAPGWSKRNQYIYDRSKIRASRLRIKEWDFYQIQSDEFVMQMTIGHVSYFGSISLNIIEFATGNRISISRSLPFCFDKLHMEPNCEDANVLKFEDKDFVMSFETRRNRRILKLHAVDEKYGKIDVEVTLIQLHRDSIVVATPYKKPNEFYYNQKINCMPTTGFAIIGSRRYTFTLEKNFGVLDFGRGVLPYSHEWYWGNASGVAENGKTVGFNVGWGFGDTVGGTENMAFFDGVGHKLSEVYTSFDENKLHENWKFTSDDGRFEMDFTPVFDNHTKTKVFPIVNNECHQIFGKYNGYFLSESGEKIEVKNLDGFLEHSVNHW